MKSSKLSLPFIDKIEINGQSLDFTINIKGNWPNPGWKYVRTDIEFDESNLSVQIRYLGSSKGGIALQVLKPFEDTISLKFPKSGKWKIVIQGKGKNHEFEKEVLK